MALQGSIDILSRFQVVGWARDDEWPDEAISLVVSTGGKVLGRVRADTLRPDLAEVGYGDGRHGFFFQMPVPLSPLVAHEISVRREGDGEPLPGSPRKLEAAALFDEDARQALVRLLSTVGEKELPGCIDFLCEQTDRLRQRHSELESGAAQKRHQRALGWQEPGIPVAPQAATETRRALVIDVMVPQLGRDAASEAILSHMRTLRRLGYIVHFVSATLEGPSPFLEGEGIVCCHRPRYLTVEEVLQRQVDVFSLVYMHRVDTASRYMALSRLHQPRARLLYSVADLHFLRYARQADVENRPELLEHSNYVRDVEIAAARQADVVVTHSSFEASLLRDHFAIADVHVIPWTVASRPTSVPFEDRGGMAFIANYGHPPNADAARWLAETVVPEVAARVPSLRCLLVGALMPPWLKTLSGPNVTAEGRVDDLADVFGRVRLTIAPLAFGAGIKGKVLTSLAAGVPCVCTSVAAEGLDLPPPLQDLVADEPAALAKIVERLHEDEAYNRHCAEAGLRYVQARLSEGALEASMRLALARKP